MNQNKTRIRLHKVEYLYELKRNLRGRINVISLARTYQCSEALMFASRRNKGKLKFNRDWWVIQITSSRSCWSGNTELNVMS